MQDMITNGAIYERWGRTECPPGGAELVYNGVTASGWWDATGNGGDYLCMPLDPNYISDASVSVGHSIYTTEYKTSSGDDIMSAVHNHDAPCAVCQVSRPSKIMIPGDNSCPSSGSWTFEYSGYLMAGSYNHASNKEYVCVDSYPESMFGSSGGSDQASYFFFIGAGCNGLFDCPPYIQSAALNCVVCTR